MRRGISNPVTSAAASITACTRETLAVAKIVAATAILKRGERQDVRVRHIAHVNIVSALGLTAMAGDVIADKRTGKSGWHGPIGLLRPSVCGCLAGYEDVNDADHLGRDPAMRWIVGGRAIERGGASTRQMGGFETELLATDDNLAALADQPAFGSTG